MKKTLLFLCAFATFSIAAMEADLESGKSNSLMRRLSSCLSSEEEAEICNFIITNYFQKEKHTRDLIAPYVIKSIRDSYDTSGSKAHEDISFLRMLLKTGKLENVDHMERLHSIIVEATGEALKKQKDEIDNRWTKKRATIYVAAMGLVSATITAGVALSVHFTDHPAD